MYNANKWLNAVDTMAEVWAKLQIGNPSIHGGINETTRLRLGMSSTWWTLGKGW